MAPMRRLGAAGSDALASPLHVRSLGDMITTLPDGRGASGFFSAFASILGASALGEVSSWLGAMAGDSVKTGSILASEALTEPASALVGSLCCSLTGQFSRIR